MLLGIAIGGPILLSKAGAMNGYLAFLLLAYLAPICGAILTAWGAYGLIRKTSTADLTKH
jgi:hypothetical protein